MLITFPLKCCTKRDLNLKKNFFQCLMHSIYCGVRRLFALQSDYFNVVVAAPFLLQWWLERHKRKTTIVNTPLQITICSVKTWRRFIPLKLTGVAKTNWMIKKSRNFDRMFKSRFSRYEVIETVPNTCMSHWMHHFYIKSVKKKKIRLSNSCFICPNGEYRCLRDMGAV